MEYLTLYRTVQIDGLSIICVASRPKWQASMRETQPRLPVISGKHDLSFELTEPEAYRRDLPNALIHVLDNRPKQFCPIVRAESLAHQAKRPLVLRDSGSGWVDLGSPDRVLGLLAKEVNQPAWLCQTRGLSPQVRAMGEVL